jgi:protein-tyrosine phosphatase
MLLSSEIFWIAGDPPPGLAIVLCPWGNYWLSEQLQTMKSSGIDVLVSMLEHGEAAQLGLSNEGALAEQNGINFLSFPIQDAHIPPDLPRFEHFVGGLADTLRAGKRIGVHCRGSIGRATITAACTLAHLGWEPEAALRAIEKARGCEVPDTWEQQEWILNYEVQP